jgi:predicted nucleic acid-binding protein
MYLLDTNVLSETRKAGKANAGVLDWTKKNSVEDSYVSVMSIFELDHGIALLERKDPLQAKILRGWFEVKILDVFQHRILSIDLAVATACAKLHVPDPMADRDSFIAATALVHGLTLVTRNTRDFERAGIKLFNPWLQTNAPPY